MEVKFNTNVEAVEFRPGGSGKARSASPGKDSAAFEQSVGLNQALDAAPVTRVEAVARAQNLIGDVSYPPRETIQRIAALLAMQLGADAAGPPSAAPPGQT